MINILDLIGKKYEKLIIVRTFIKDNFIYCKCMCECGNIIEVAYDSLQLDKIQSCGCNTIILNKKEIQKARKRLYKIWWGIKNRCYNTNCSVYKNYDNQGIIMCTE